MSSTGLNNPYNNKSSSKNFEQFSPYASSTLKLPSNLIICFKKKLEIERKGLVAS